MSLLFNATSTLERLTRLRTAAEGAEEAKALDSLRGELAELASPINALAAMAVTLRGEGVSLSAIPDLANVREILQKALERLLEIPKATTLRQGNRWTNLTKKLQTLAEKAQASQLADWQQYFDHHFFSGLSPAQQEMKMDKTPQNAQALLRYRTLFQSFIKYRLQPPTNFEDFKKLHSLSQQLTEIAFTDNAPKDVRKFLDAVSGGAGLHLLTPEVFAWLRDNQMLANYVVRARIN